MLRHIHIQGYKCLKEAHFDTSNLNIFAGPNSSGKSSTIQMLLLLRQSATEQRKVPGLSLSGELYEGGTAIDILHPESNYKVNCNLTNDTKSFQYNFAWIRDAEDKSQTRSLSAIDTSCDELLTELASQNFIYLNAERSRPRAFFAIPSDRLGLAGMLGKHGEFTAARLARAGSGKNVIDWDDEAIGLRQRLKLAQKQLDHIEFPDELMKSEGRIDQLTKRMISWIMPGAYFDVIENERTDAAVLDFVRDREQTSSKVRPTHMGFGLTYALPVIASGFFTPPGGVIIVENPEAHLHPYSQSRLGVLLAIIAASGRQVFVETHSDHFVNGVRVAITHGLISHNQLKIHFFKPPIEGTTADIVGIDCNEKGRMSDWPAGFFDQIENDLSRI